MPGSGQIPLCSSLLLLCHKLPEQRDNRCDSCTDTNPFEETDALFQNDAEPQKMDPKCSALFSFIYLFISLLKKETH